MVPKADSDTEVNSLKSGEVGMIFPQAFAGITDALNDPNIKYTPGYGTNYEDLYFQQSIGVFKDPIFRAAFSMSVDRDLILKTIYEPIFPGSELLQCGVWVPTVGKWCDERPSSTNSYDPAGRREAAHRQRLEEGRRRLLGRPQRQRADHPLDGQHRQQAP